jgi:hypothetical protein
MEVYGDKITSIPLHPSLQTENVEIKDVDPERSVTVKLIGKDMFKEIIVPAGHAVATISVKCE